MHQLRLFGGVHLENVPDLLSGRAAQRKRLALLGLLGVTSRPVSRDRLIGLLWPEADEERARPLLASALYDLRRALGEDCITSAGDDLRLNPHRITTDAWQFEEAIAVRDWPRAAALYRGPFMDGLFVSGSVELERWIDDERRRFARSWAEALEKYAEELEQAGDQRAAAACWERLASAEPFSPRIAMRLMRSLAEAGEVQRAIDCARIYESRSRAEEMRPDPAVAELAADLARRVTATRAAHPHSEPEVAAHTPETAAGSQRRLRPRALAFAGFAIGIILVLAAMLTNSDRSVDLIAAGVLPDTPSIIVADFKSAEASAPGRAVAEWFRTDLSQSPYVRPLPTQRLSAALKRMQLDPGAPVPTPLAVDIARREGAAGILAGDVAKLGDSYVITAFLLDADGREVFRARETAAAQADLLKAISSLSAHVRRAVGESRKSLRASPPLPRVTSTSVEALLLFRRSRQAGLRLDDRVALLEQALRHDSTFAMAYANLAAGAGSSGQAVRASYYARKAYENNERLPEPERSYTVGAYRDLTLGDRAGAIAVFRGVTERFPRNVVAHSYIADLLLREQRWQEAERAAPMEIMLAPRAYAGHSNLMYAQLAQGNRRAAKLTLAAADSLSDSEHLFLTLHYYEATRDYAEAARWLDSLATADDVEPYQIWSHRIDFALAQGQLRKAAQIAAEQLTTPAQRLSAAASVARVRLRLAGDTAREVAAVESALRRDPLASVPDIHRPYVPLAEFFADAELPARAQQYLAEFRASPAYRADHPGMAALARAQGRLSDAANAYEKLNKRDSSAECTYMYAFDLGHTYELSRDITRAIAAYEQGVNAFGCQYRDVALGHAYLALSRLYRLEGNHDRSRHYAVALDKLWQDADSELQRLRH